MAPVEQGNIEELYEALEGLLGPAILGSQSRDELIRDWGMLGVRKIDFARAVLTKARGET